jgi:mono/diheme cytochrome c family protein
MAPKIKPLYINIALVGVIFFLMFINFFVHVDPEKRNPVLIDGMQHSDAVYTQESGRRLNMVIEGTVLHGEEPLHYGSGPVESEKAGRELSNPYTRNDKEAVARGQLVYERMCMTCHVETSGQGQREVVKRGVPEPPALITKRVDGFKDGYIFNYITNGGALMPAHGPQIPAQDRWKVIAYMRHRLNNEKGNLE